MTTTPSTDAIVFNNINELKRLQSISDALSIIRAVASRVLTTFNGIESTKQPARLSVTVDGDGPHVAIDLPFDGGTRTITLATKTEVRSMPAEILISIFALPEEPLESTSVTTSRDEQSAAGNCFSWIINAVVRSFVKPQPAAV